MLALTSTFRILIYLQELLDRNYGTRSGQRSCPWPRFMCNIFFVSTVGKAFCVWQDQFYSYVSIENPHIQPRSKTICAFLCSPIAKLQYASRTRKYRKTQKTLKGYRKWRPPHSHKKQRKATMITCRHYRTHSRRNRVSGRKVMTVSVRFL